jgi:hypothetical protein
MARPLIIDDCPPHLLKAYPHQHWADEFVCRGLVRMRKPSAFRATGDSRADSGEGDSHLMVPGDVPFVIINRLTGEHLDSGTQPGHFNYQSEFVNPTYIFCASGSAVDAERLQSNFGEFLVEIKVPQTFLERLNNAISDVHIGDREWSFIDGFPVRYTRGSIAARPEDSGERLRLSYGQKSDSYAWETEFRAAAVLSGPTAGSPAEIDVVLGSLEDIAIRRY